MKEFRIKAEGIKEIRRQALARTVPLTLVAIAAGISLTVINSDEGSGIINVLPYVIPIAIIAMVVGLYSGVSRQRKLYESYSLRIAGNVITRHQMNTPTISIHTNEVKSIFKDNKGSLIINGRNSSDIINIPPQIEDFAGLEAALEEIRPVEMQGDEYFLKKYQAYISLLTIGLMYCVYSLSNKIVVAISGVILIAILSWSFLEIRRNKNIDSRTKQIGWWILLVLASIIGVMFFKLTGSLS